MPRILVNVMFQDGYSVHFISPCGTKRVGPWLIRQTPEQLRTVLGWGVIAGEDRLEQNRVLEMSGRSSVYMHLTGRQYRALLREGVRRPQGGYELEQWHQDHQAA